MVSDFTCPSGIRCFYPTQNTPSEYYMECAACTNDGFREGNKIKNSFCSQVLEVCYFSGF